MCLTNILYVITNLASTIGIISLVILTSIVFIRRKKVSSLKYVILNVLSGDITEMSPNWNKRYRENMDKIKSGNIFEVAEVVKNLAHKSAEKGLSTGEKKLYNSAKQILVSELVLANQSSKNEIEDYYVTYKSIYIN